MANLKRGCRIDRRRARQPAAKDANTSPVAIVKRKRKITSKPPKIDAIVVRADPIKSKLADRELNKRENWPKTTIYQSIANVVMGEGCSEAVKDCVKNGLKPKNKLHCGCGPRDRCEENVNCACYQAAKSLQKAFNHASIWTSDNDLPFNKEQFDKFHCEPVVQCGPECRCKGRCKLNVLKKMDEHEFIIERHDVNKGFAVYTQKDIKKGSPIMSFNGALSGYSGVCKDEESEQYSIVLMDGKPEADLAKALADLPNIDKQYSEQLKKTYAGSKLWINPVKQGSTSRFLSHGCKSKIYLARVFQGGFSPANLRIVMIAFEDIPAGSELTFDYGNTYVNAHLRKCLCDHCIQDRDNEKFAEHDRKKAESLQSQQNISVSTATTTTNVAGRPKSNLRTRSSLKNQLFEDNTAVDAPTKKRKVVSRAIFHEQMQSTSNDKKVDPRSIRAMSQDEERDQRALARQLRALSQKSKDTEIKVSQLARAMVQQMQRNLRTDSNYNRTTSSRSPFNVRTPRELRADARLQKCREIKQEIISPNSDDNFSNDIAALSFVKVSDPIQSSADQLRRPRGLQRRSHRERNISRRGDQLNTSQKSLETLPTIMKKDGAQIHFQMSPERRERKVQFLRVKTEPEDSQYFFQERSESDQFQESQYEAKFQQESGSITHMGRAIKQEILSSDEESVFSDESDDWIWNQHNLKYKVRKERKLRNEQSIAQVGRRVQTRIPTQIYNMNGVQTRSRERSPSRRFNSVVLPRFSARLVQERA